jgi:NitT/TauT family transport system permease protein
MGSREAASVEFNRRDAHKPALSAGYLAWRRQKLRRAAFVRFAQIALVVVFLALWEVAARKTWVNPLFTSYPSAVWTSFLGMLRDGQLQTHLSVTLTEIVLSFAFSSLLGLALAIGLWLAPTVQRIVDPFVAVANAVPKIALVPIFYIWLGVYKSIYGIAVALSVFVVLITIYSGFRQSDANKVKLARAFGASRPQILFRVVLPENVVTILAALKANIGLALAGVIVGEFQAAKAGLGYLIMYGSQTFQMDMVMSAVILLSAIALGLYLLVGILEKRAAGVRNV